jgi:hypothetical protein
MIVGYATSEIYVNGKLIGRNVNPVIDDGINVVRYIKRKNSVWVQNI